MLTYDERARTVMQITVKRGLVAAEDYIEAIPVEDASDQQRSALWLLAWAYASRNEQRQVAAEGLALAR